MGCICPEKGHLFLILIKAPSACQAVHLQGCLYLAGKSFAHLYKGYGAIWASRSPANEKNPDSLPQWLFCGRTQTQDWSIRILPWTFIWQLEILHLIARVAKLKGNKIWLPPCYILHYMESLCAALSKHKEGRRVERWKHMEQALTELLVPTATEISTNISYLHEPMDSSSINWAHVEFLLYSNERVLIYTSGTLISSVVAIC